MNQIPPLPKGDPGGFFGDMKTVRDDGKSPLAAFLSKRGKDNQSKIVAG
jgi:hypothetical protein